MRKLSLFAAAAVLAMSSLSFGAAKVGEKAPDFSLQDQDGKTVSLADYKGKIVVLEWVNPECPVVVRHADAKTMVTTQSKFKDQGVVWLGVNSTSSATKDDSKKWVKDRSLAYPVLDDAKGEVGKAYGAKTTPHMFVIDKEGKLAYAGGIDNDPSGRGKEKVNYVDQAVSELLAGTAVSVPESKAYGCSVKYAK